MPDANAGWMLMSVARRRRPHPAGNVHMPVALAGKIATVLWRLDEMLSLTTDDFETWDEAFREIGELLADSEIRYWLELMREQRLVEETDVVVKQLSKRPRSG